jgi:hemerythrin-like domain-containing protein
MPDTLLLLRLEHGNTAKLLDIIGAQIGKLNQAEDIDCELIGLVVDYLRSYEDKCHHPKEDLIFRALCKRNPEAVKVVGDLTQEHDNLARVTEALAREVEATQESKHRVIELKLKTLLTDFLISYRRHLAMEEKHFFPAALRELTEGDWEEIDFDAFDRKNPLFSEAVEERFERLREQILTRSA